MVERLGRYTVLKHLASGGMADVLVARTEGIEGFARHVVLKRIRAEHAKDQRFIDMFLDEARLAANLHHQNIVQVHDIGESAGEYFFAMEYLHGEDLRAMLSIVSKTRTHMPLGYVVSVISSVAAGLHHAHERRGPDKKPLNIVHRDVSPSNIHVGYDGSVKVVDFGIAKAAMRQVETRSGSLKGKVSYMSPEQCKMGAIDRRSDVYALGVVLYEMATTTRLFKSDSDYLVMDAICTGKIPLPRVRRPDLPNELSTIIMKALATDPDRRYQTADEMRVALDAFATKQSLTASATTIGSYVIKLCGEKPEPWLDGTESSSEDMGRKSWSDLPTVGGTGPDAEAKTITDGRGKRRASTPAPVAAVVDARASTDPAGTRTSTKLGWEQGTPPNAPARSWTPAKIAMIVVPLVAVVGVLVWRLAASPDAAPARPAVAATAPTMATVAVVSDKTVERVAEGVPVTKTDVKVATTKPATTKPVKTKPTTKPAATPTTKPVATAPKTVTTAPTTAAVTLPQPPVVTTPPPPPPTQPAAEVALASSVVNGLASKNRKALLACENGEPLQGDLTIKFTVNAEGQVVRSAAQSTLNKPAVSNCILLALRTWKFPKQAATGTYAISFQ